MGWKKFCAIAGLYWFVSLHEQEAVIENFSDTISVDEETPFDNEVQFEGSNEENEDLPAVPES